MDDPTVGATARMRMLESAGFGRWGCMALCAVAMVLWMPAPSGAQTAARKFGRGLAAMTTGFLEVPGNMVAETRARGPAEGLPLGFAKGLGMIVVRELVGVYEFLSAPFPAPDGYRPIIEPEFPWSYFQESSSRPVHPRHSHRKSPPPNDSPP